MRIAMLLENNPYPQDVRVRSEAQSLARAGHRVTVIAPRHRGQRRRETVAGVRVIRFRAIDGSGRGAAGFMLEYLLAGLQLQLLALGQLLRGTAVLHLHNPPDVLFGVAAVYRLLGRRVVFDHHDLFPETIELRFGPGLASSVARWCQSRTIDVANHVLATNASYAEVALARKPAPAVSIVRNAPPAAWTQLPLVHRDGAVAPLRLVYVGAIAPQDGVVGLVDVLAALRDGPAPLAVQLTIVGDGSERDAVASELERRGLAEQVRFAGWVGSGTVIELIREADVCVDPAPATDVNTRSTMIKIAEYLALGKPVVAFDLLETRRTAGAAALLVPDGDTAAFADAIRRLAGDPDLRRRLSEAARARACEQLTWERSETALLRAYASLGR